MVTLPSMSEAQNSEAQDSTIDRDSLSPETAALAWRAADKLDAWVRANGWAGYDPYDILGHRYVISPRNGVQRLMGQIMLQAARLAPLATRRLLRFPKLISPMGMGLFAESYRRLHVATGESRYLELAEEALDWLDANQAETSAGRGWGSPFDWRSRRLIPAGTPCGVVSCVVGDAYLGFYAMTGEERYLAACRGIAEFLTHGLNIDDMGGGRVCISYSPLDRFHVHNANLHAAEFLIRLGEETGVSSHVELGRRAVEYSVSEQNEDGSLCYWGRDQASGLGCHIDHYHTGFEIRSLHSIWRTTGERAVKRALERYYRFYCKALFDEAGRPKHTPDSLYPVNILSCAEAIRCHGTLLSDFAVAEEHLERALPWVLTNMQRRDGAFIYMITGRLRRRLSVPYMRWGQAWMMRALTEVAPYHLQDRELADV